MLNTSGHETLPITLVISNQGMNLARVRDGLRKSDCPMQQFEFFSFDILGDFTCRGCEKNADPHRQLLWYLKNLHYFYHTR